MDELKEKRKSSGKEREKDSKKSRNRSPSSSSRGESSRKDERKSSKSHSHRIPNPIFGDDLLRAERAEAQAKDEREWKEKLDHLASEDFAGSEFGRYPAGMGDVDADDLAWENEMQRHFSRRDREREREFEETIPKRWRNKGPAPVRLEEMDEEEYAEAIRSESENHRSIWQQIEKRKIFELTFLSLALLFLSEGMWQRSHGKEIEEMEKAKAAREKAAAAEAKAKAERRAAKKKKQQEAIKKTEKEFFLKARSDFHTKWKELRESTIKSPIFFSNLPWPTLPATAIQPLSLSKSSIEQFLFSHSSTEEGPELHRLALRLYHPDRFTAPSGWWRRVELGGERNIETVKEASKRVSQSLAEIGRERKEKTKKEKEKAD